MNAGSASVMSSLDCVRIFEKYIPQDLGRHVASFHLDLAQLWRCPVSWCTIWRGTPQDCIDHMHRAHTVPVMVKAANLARWFPPWTVSWERWSTVLRSSDSGVATYTLLFSWIGVPLVYRYRVFSHAGTHVDFRGAHMARLRTFLNAADAVCLQSCNRRRARSLASQMSTEVPVGGHSRKPADLSQPSTSRRPFFQFPASTSVAAMAPESLTHVVVRSRQSSRWAISVPIDLALPRFASPDFQMERLLSQWVAKQESPASPSPLTSPSLCLNLDTLSSDWSAGPGDVSAHPHLYL